MITLTGKKVSEGIAIGKLSFYKRDIKEVRHIYVKDVEKEISRLQKAKERALFELQELYEISIREVGKANAAIFEMQQDILDNDGLWNRITSIILEEKLNAEYAVKTATEEYLKDNRDKSNDDPDSVKELER